MGIWVGSVDCDVCGTRDTGLYKRVVYSTLYTDGGTEFLCEECKQEAPNQENIEEIEW